MTDYIIVAVIGYLFGCIPMSYFAGRLFGRIDIRKSGSGNAGATNVMRTLGLKVGIFALVGDFTKGVLAVLVGRYIAGDNGAMISGLLAVVGHCYPFTIGFKGGKGVATSAGVILIISPFVFSVVLIVQIFVVATTRYMSLASLISAVLLPIVCYLAHLPMTTIIFSLFFSALVIFKHAENIKRLVSGTEKRISFKKEK